MKNRTVVNVAEIAAPDWNFIERHYPADARPVDWRYYSASPANLLERRIPRPKISRYRACWQATRALHGSDDLVISHLPRTSHWQSVFMNAMSCAQRHIAFSFNFTELPVGRTRAQMSRSFERIERFVVYSDFERQLYADHFQLPIDKFQQLHWAMDKPDVDADFKPVWSDYYSAIGGEGRDYPTLLRAFEKLPHLRLIIVSRPEALAGLHIPPNVHSYRNLPNAQYWAVLARSKALILPLRDDRTPCGHITLVGGMLLGKPIITTFSHGTADYAHAEQTAVVTPANDAESITAAVQRLETDPDLAARLGRDGQAFAEQHCSPQVWGAFIRRCVEAG